jgi:ribosome-associated protein
MNKENHSYLDTVLTILDDGKAESVEVIDVRDITDITDYMVIASGTSSRHISVLADKVADAIKALGAAHVGIEGQAVANWVLVDAHQVIVHLFQHETRLEYNLEELYKAAGLQKK